MRAVIFLIAVVAAQDKTTTWEMLEDMKASQYTAETNFEMHRAETENLQDWRDMRTKCSGALDHYMSQQYPNIQTLLNDMVNDDDTWFTHAMAFDALKQHQLDMEMDGNSLPYAPYADNGGTNDHEQEPPHPEPVATVPEPHHPEPEPVEEPCHCEHETEDSCESAKCSKWCFLMEDKEDICYTDDTHHVEYSHHYTQTACLEAGGVFVPNEPECRGLMVWTADPMKCFDESTGWGLSADECSMFPEDCHMQKAGICGPIENVHHEYTPCMNMDGMPDGCYKMNEESADRCYWMADCASGGIPGADGDEGCDNLFCGEGGDCPDWCDPMRVKHTQTGEWHACHEIMEEQECNSHPTACAFELHGTCEPPNEATDGCHTKNPEDCKAAMDNGKCIQETYSYGVKCYAHEH